MERDAILAMNILYHLTVLPPKIPAGEALSQEIDALRARFGGDLIYLNPNPGSPLTIPRLLFGFHKLGEIRRREAAVDLHHFYNPDPFPFSVLRWFKRPVVYSISSGVGERQPNIRFLSSLAAVTVADERSLARLQSWGLANVFLVRSGINVARFKHNPRPLGSEIRLMAGSAPWTVAQFSTKGVDALLAAAQQMPQLRIIFLWRGVLAEEMVRRVRRLNLEQQVQVLDQLVDVNQVLANVHASVTLATDPAIIKAYPHSLLDSLAAGKPVLVSRAIPMSEYVVATGCGRVVEEVTAEALLAAVTALVAEYDTIRKRAEKVGQRDFSQEAMIESFQRVYEHVLGAVPA